MKRYIVDSAAIRQNLETLKKRAGKAQLFAVVKGNGYGLGLVPLAAICRDAGVTTFCVTEVLDAKQLRRPMHDLADATPVSPKTAGPV